MTDKIKVAFVKFGGLAAGGTEKALQTIAANLPQDKFDVDYYYCDAAPYVNSDFKHPDTDPHRKKYMEKKGVNLIKFSVSKKDITTPTHDWIDTDFWWRFDEDKYDVLVTARAGHAEYPFTHIHKVPQVDLVTLPGMAERKTNVHSTVHISQYQANTWIKAGGDPTKYEVIPLFDELPRRTTKNMREELGISENVFVYGMHQRDDDGIYSPVPLQAYSQIEDANSTAFVLLGGSEKYEQQASELGLSNFYKLPHSGDKTTINRFLSTLNVFSHGRADGETFSLAIAEALRYGLPVVSHIAPATGHKETIGEAGFVTESVDAYAERMRQLHEDKSLYSKLSKEASKHFEKNLSLKANMERWVSLLQEVVYGSPTDELEDEDFWNEMW